MIRKALRDERAEHPLDGDVDFRHQVDRPFLVDVKVAAEPFELKLSGLHDRFDRGRQQQRMRRHSSVGPG